MFTVSVDDSPSKTRDGIYKSCTSSSAYKDYIETLCARNPSLLTLHAFLSHPRVPGYDCRLAALDFRKGIIDPIARQPIEVNGLPYELNSKAEASHEANWEYVAHELRGRILVIDDLTAEIIELLGTQLDIDPLFFALHLHVAHRTNMSSSIPEQATLPSRIRSKDYINISYHRPVIFDKGNVSNDSFTRNTSINRKLVFLRSTGIGLAQHRASVIKVQRQDDFWLGR